MSINQPSKQPSLLKLPTGSMRALAVSLVVVVLSAIVLARSILGTGPGPRILSDVGHEIQVVVCSATSARTSSLRNADLVSSIVNGLPGEVQVLVLVSDRKAFKTKNQGHQVKFVEMPEDTGLSIWPQDPFVVVGQPGKTRLLVPCDFGREDDRQIAGQLSQLLDLEVIQSELYFEGGNIVCNEREVFIGFDTILFNARLLQETNDEIEARFTKEFGRPVVTVGNRQQEIAHIDMIITPLSGNRIAVADSRGGAHLAQRALREAPQQVRGFEQHCQDQFFGSSKVEELVDLEGDSIRRPTVVGQTQKAIKASLAVADSLDGIADQMSGKGYEVVRIAALIPSQQPRRGKDGEKKPGYPVLTYNNVLTETRAGVPVVYLPQYGWGTFDQAAVERWKVIGFSVKPINGFSTSAMYGGSLRCCTKVLLRK